MNSCLLNSQINKISLQIMTARMLTRVPLIRLTEVMKKVGNAMSITQENAFDLHSVGTVP